MHKIGINIKCENAVEMLNYIKLTTNVEFWSKIDNFLFNIFNSYNFEIERNVYVVNQTVINSVVILYQDKYKGKFDETKFRKNLIQMFNLIPNV